MINLILHSRYGDEYEIVAGGGAPLSSCGCRYDADDFTYTRQFISHLLVTPEAWRNLLLRLGYSLPPNINHPAEIFDVVARFCLRGALAFYKLPRIESLQALSSGEGWGICLVKGPNPHCHSELEIFEVSTPEEAEALLESVSATEQNLVRVMFVNNMTQWFSFDGDTRGKVIQMLAKRELLAYKVEVTENAPPPKAADYVAATGPGYDKVALGPESNSSPAPVKVEPVKAQPQTLGEAAALLQASRAQLEITNKYTPKYSSAELDAMAKSGDIAKERFIVTVQKNKLATQAVGYQRTGGPTTTWTTTFDLLERADTDPELICDLNGMHYDSSASYEVIIIDQGKYYKQDGAENFVPTYERLGVLGKREFAEEFTSGQIDHVLTPEYTQEYKQAMAAYSKTAGKPWEEENVNEFIKGYYPDDVEKQKLFKARNEFNTQVGCNEHFSGDGVTKTTGLSRYGLEQGQNGNLEMLLFEHSPETIADLEGEGREAILRIPAKPIRRA